MECNYKGGSTAIGSFKLLEDKKQAIKKFGHNFDYTVSTYSNQQKIDIELHLRRLKALIFESLLILMRRTINTVVINFPQTSYNPLYLGGLCWRQKRSVCNIFPGLGSLGLYRSQLHISWRKKPITTPLQKYS